MITGTLLNQILMFRTIAEQGSISAAARLLEVAPPSVSNALKALEQHVGVPLFARTTRQITLTDAGQQLLRDTSTPIDGLSTAVEAVCAYGHEAVGPIRVTLPRFVFNWLIEPIYGQFCQAYPNIALEFSLSDGLVDVVKDKFDLGLRFGDKVSLGMVAKQVTAPIQEALFVSPDYQARQGLAESIDALKDHRFIQYRYIGSNQLVPLILNVNGQETTIPTQPALIVNDIDVVVDSALKGLGIGRAPRACVQNYLDSGELIPVLTEWWKHYAPIYLYFQQHSQKSKRIRLFIDFVLASTQGLR